MPALPSQPSKFSSSVLKKIEKISASIELIIKKMDKESQYMPKRELLEEYAEEIIDLINDHHAELGEFESFLKAAIIDLTEVPDMAPQMQRIAFLTALKDALSNLRIKG